MQNNFELHDLSKKVEVQIVGSISLRQVAADQFLVDKGEIITIPSHLYGVTENDVVELFFCPKVERYLWHGLVRTWRSMSRRRGWTWQWSHRSTRNRWGWGSIRWGSRCYECCCQQRKKENAFTHLPKKTANVGLCHRRSSLENWLLCLLTTEILFFKLNAVSLTICKQWTFWLKSMRKRILTYGISSWKMW